jgi:N-acetylglutamate synthase-like GNAT family acetyltransferase
MIDIRRAVAGDAETLTEISHAAKRHWGYPENWIEHWKDDLTISGEFIAANEVYMAVDGEQILGCCALVVTEGKADLEHLWIRPEQMGAGVGRALFVHAMERAAQLHSKTVNILSDPNAAGFYEHMGATPAGSLEYELEGKTRVLPRYSVDLSVKKSPYQ